MAQIANSLSRKIYVTDDNPRNEDPKQIRTELENKIDKNKCFNIGNRTEAIKKSIINSEPNGIVLIAGKGHEEQQIYKNKIFYISDKQIVKNLKLRIKVLSKKDQNYLQNRMIIKKITGRTKLGDYAGLKIDSRMVKKNNLFLTIKGVNMME